MVVYRRKNNLCLRTIPLLTTDNSPVKQTVEGVTVHKVQYTWEAQCGTMNISECLVYKPRGTMSQWRSEGLQRPGANACIGAPPFGLSENRQAKKKKKKSGPLKARGP